MLDKLKGLNGADFTKQYHSDQVTAHKDAVSLYQRYAKGGDNGAFKDMTTKTLPTLEHHLTMAQDPEQVVVNERALTLPPPARTET